MVELPDGTQFSARHPQTEKAFAPTENGLVLFRFVGWGGHFLSVAYGSGQGCWAKKSSEEQFYSKGYQEGLKKMQQQMERRIAVNPNDRDALRDLNQVREELTKAGVRPENYQKSGFLMR